ncbi:AraC family transcriptional regulator [Oculatella sp. LEGE 06141]|uniref:AraC family transcriptional regulator n=1 Tax=Oculatella sp. LEGE 06141 TaxID=1828648 RepID=UPI00187E5496|nr:AraC family transcriptional regulator [Oculatella sp. LEGE 06141]MBE9179697.1 AraC family transcriptional regulator [Oculatella sp. LEGE 06141]
MDTRLEFARLWKPAGISGVELFSAQLFRHSFAKHMHEEYTIGMNDGGRGCYTYRGEARFAYPGSFNLINPGEVHTGQAERTSGWKFRNIYISVPQTQHVLAQLEWRSHGLPSFVEPVVWDRPLQSSFGYLFKALNEPTTQLEQETRMIEFLSRLFLRHTEPHQPLRSPKPETKAISLIRAYLEAHYTEPISIDTLSHLAGLSPYYLIRSFHQQVGLPPHGYQRHWQLLQAKRSLQTPTSLAEIAIEHGFYDQSHLNRYFKRTFGIAPGQYQKSYLSR